MALAAPHAQAAIPPTPLPPPVLKALQDAKLPLSSVSVWVAEVNQPHPLLSHQADKSMAPASVMKLVTTAAALDILQPNFRFTTPLRVQASAWAKHREQVQNPVLASPLYLQGSGDPKLTFDVLQRLLRPLYAEGIRELNGDLVIDRQRFAPAEGTPADFDGQGQRAYNVLPDAALLNFKAIEIQLTPLPDGSVRVQPEPPLTGLTLVNQLRSSPATTCGDWRQGIQAQHQSPPPHTQSTLTLSGTLAQGCGERTYALALWSANDYAQALFRAAWESLGGRWQGQVRDGSAPADSVEVNRVSSAPLSELVRDINKWSNNVMARQLLLGLAAYAPQSTAANTTPPADNDDNPVSPSDSSPLRGVRPRDAAAVVQRWLSQQGIDARPLVLDNGSGLSRQERLSAALLGQLLHRYWHSPRMPEFVASLPIIARDGTMLRRLGNSPAAGQGWIKTGLLNDAKSIAGYVQDQHQRRYAVVMLVNHPQAENSGKAMDALLRWIAER